MTISVVVKLRNDIQNLLLEIMENNIDISTYDSYKKLIITCKRLDNIFRDMKKIYNE